jgi:hypothetical protein
MTLDETIAEIKRRNAIFKEFGNNEPLSPKELFEVGLALFSAFGVRFDGHAQAQPRRSCVKEGHSVPLVVRFSTSDLVTSGLHRVLFGNLRLFV